ncbi:MAG: putative bifunctional diguanylate cyclase/phosphodiesterase [Angustibacter sp.]
MDLVMHRGNIHRWASLLWVVLVGAVLAFAARLDAPGSADVPAEQDLLRDLWLFNMGHVVAAVLCWTTPAKGRARTGWQLIAVGLLVAAAANAYSTLVVADLDPVPYPSASDAAWWVFYALAALGIGLQVRARVAQVQPSMWLDGLVAALGVAALGLSIAPEALWRSLTGPLATVVTNLGYLALDLILLTLLVGVSVATRVRPDRSLVALAAGVMLLTATDIWLLPLNSNGGYAQGEPVNVLWLLFVCAFALSAQLQRGEPAVRAEDLDQRVGWRVLTLPIVFNVMSLGLLAASWRMEIGPVAEGCAIGCALAATVRAALTFQEIRDLPEARRQARTDELTGVANRRGLYRRCEELLDGPTGPSRCALLLLDLDGFKEVNDALGHHAGDDLLVQVAQRLRQIVEPHGLLARLGGDEFAVLLPQADSAQAVSLAWDVQEAMTAPFVVETVRFHIGGSIGVATAPAPAATRSELLRCADVAMYQAKASGTGGVVRYAPDPRSPIGERLRTIEELREALAGDQLVVYLQPQLQLSTGAVTGVEALVRWQHPSRGLLTPAAFLPHVEQAGLQRSLAEVVLDLALRAASTWWDAGRQLPVSINLTASDVTDQSLPVKIVDALRSHGLPPQALTVELTEQTLLTDPVEGRRVLEELRDNGIGVSIDDYGTGYSSLSYLRDLPADELKLDRTLNVDLEIDVRAAAIVEHTVALAHTLGLRVVAEGVETSGSAAVLADLGCDIGQGHHLARPMPGEELTRWLTSMPPATAPMRAG